MKLETGHRDYARLPDHGHRHGGNRRRERPPRGQGDRILQDSPGGPGVSLPGRGRDHLPSLGRGTVAVFFGGGEIAETFCLACAGNALRDVFR